MPVDFLDRRTQAERRRRDLVAYWRGARSPRRRTGRRAHDYYPIIDWHPPRVLFAAIAVLTLCSADAILTLRLLGHGAIEANPLMALLVPHEPHWFAIIKLLLTAIGLIVLVACAGMKLLRRLPGEAVLAGIVVCYAALVIYELYLLHGVQNGYFSQVTG